MQRMAGFAIFAFNQGHGLHRQATTAHTFGHIGRIKTRLFRARFDLAAQIGRHIARAVHHLFMGENLGLHKGADG